MKLPTLFAGAVAALIASSSFAADYVADKDHSSISFTVRHLVSRVTGQFTDFTGRFAFDPATKIGKNAEFTIQAASISTGTPKRDNHLRSPDFFDVKKYPTITFISRQVEMTGGTHAKVTGDLTMHGVTKPVTFDAEYLGATKDPMGTEKVGFEAIAKLNRKDFGINWNKVLDSGGLMLSDEVDIKVNLEANATKPAATAAQKK
jgi:polyisoprenoid-binding protein YceI